jgi:endonuclease YncB( thermonuclease family)
MAGRRELVMKVVDGDTLRTASRKNPIRLANIEVKH